MTWAHSRTPLFFSLEIVLAAGSHVSFAGVCNILYHDSSTGDTYNINGGWNKPYYIDLAHMPKHHSDRSNGASVLVPGFIAAVSTASEKYGRLPLSKLLEPAKYFSQKGFKLPSYLAQNIKRNYNPRSLLRTKEGTRLRYLLMHQISYLLRAIYTLIVQRMFKGHR